LPLPGILLPSKFPAEGNSNATNKITQKMKRMFVPKKNKKRQEKTSQMANSK